MGINSAHRVGVPAFRAARVEQKIVKIPKNEIVIALGRSKGLAGRVALEIIERQPQQPAEQMQVELGVEPRPDHRDDRPPGISGPSLYRGRARRLDRSRLLRGVRDRLWRRQMAEVTASREMRPDIPVLARFWSNPTATPGQRRQNLL